MAIYLDGDRLTFDFTDYHPRARMSIEFQRTLRIPDDGKEYPLPPGLGRFPIRHVEDYQSALPESWLRRGGVLFPMYQAEAMWIRFQTGDYPFALKVASGKINAVSGDLWSLGLNRDPQDYLVTPGQPWVDGFCVGEGVVRQFVAMPLGKGYTAEEQITAQSTWGGIQIAAYPLKKDRYQPPRVQFQLRSYSVDEHFDACRPSPMGLAPGGMMHQEIYQDRHALSDWNQRKGERCFIAILNSEDWRAVTSEQIPAKPITAQDYASAGLPWFDYYNERPAVGSSDALRRLKGVAETATAKDEFISDLDTTVPITRVVKLGSGRRGEVRVGDF